ncbi:MAG: hypothetical protein OXF06_05425 [Bacteroidetes bacterium]|nr:hypothetical protein [Bacteroidota bacterium]MCY4224259.1 hypothetical protein [Bacteroidota bacterium]
MDQNQENNHDQSSEAKDAFGKLELDQKVLFLITESVNTAVEAASAFADRLTEECSEIFNSTQTHSRKSDDTSEDKESTKDPS